jgi:hypothetical protein
MAGYQMKLQKKSKISQTASTEIVRTKRKKHVPLSAPATVT